MGKRSGCRNQEKPLQLRIIIHTSFARFLCQSIFLRRLTVSNKSSWLLQSRPRATRQVTLSGCPSSPFPPSQGFLLGKSEALLRAGGSSPSPSAMVLIGSLNLKNRLNGEQGFLWGEKVEGPRVCAGVPWVLKAGRDGLRSPSSLFSPAC